MGGTEVGVGDAVAVAAGSGVKDGTGVVGDGTGLKGGSEATAKGSADEGVAGAGTLVDGAAGEPEATEDDSGIDVGLSVERHAVATAPTAARLRATKRRREMRPKKDRSRSRHFLSSVSQFMCPLPPNPAAKAQSPQTAT